MLTVLENGYNFNLPDGNTAKSHIIVLSGHFDTPARDDFLYKIHHNGVSVLAGHLVINNKVIVQVSMILVLI